MKKTLTIILSLFAIICTLVLVAGFYRFNLTDGGDILSGNNASTTIARDVKNSTYTIEGENFTLMNGVAVKEIAPGSASKNTLRIFGEPVYHDLNGDTVLDAALLLENTPGGSGTFYYAVLAIATGSTFVATNALLLGDRVAPQNINIENGRAVYNYAVRKSGEPMTTQPSIGKSLYIHYDSKIGEIGEWVKDFEGEANPSTMKLTMKKWAWVSTETNDGAVVRPKKSGTFTLTFGNDGKVNLGTDCNAVGGKYTTQGNQIAFSEIVSTEMFCEGSQESAFVSTLSNISSYFFTSKGELILEIKFDSGTMMFR